MEKSMGKLLRKFGLWMRRAIASETSGGIAWMLISVLTAAYVAEFVFGKIV
jgi:hypothetical protein